MTNKEEDFKIGDKVEVKLLNGPYNKGKIESLYGVLIVKYSSNKRQELSEILKNKAFTIVNLGQ